VSGERLAPELKPQRDSDLGCEPATIVPVGVLVELDTEDWLIDWETEISLYHHELFVLSSSSLIPPSIMPESSSHMNTEL
jgi:hypothetical protein